MIPMMVLRKVNFGVSKVGWCAVVCGDEWGDCDMTRKRECVPDEKFVGSSGAWRLND